MAVVKVPPGEFVTLSITDGAATVYLPSSDGWRLDFGVSGYTIALDTVTAQTVTVETSYDGGTSWHDDTLSAYNRDAGPLAVPAASYTAKCTLDFAGAQGGIMRLKFLRSNATNAIAGRVYFAP
jgi:hypothetical protein